MSPAKQLRQLVANSQASGELRASSMLMTLMGDVVVPWGGEIWLGAIIALTAPLGLSDRLVRTSIYRLKAEGWVEGRKSGRRSYYRLTPSGSVSTREAEKRIYHAANSVWTGSWHLIFANNAEIPVAKRSELRKRMRWLGFGVLGPNIFGHPVASLTPVKSLLQDLALERSVMIMHARSIGNPGSEAARDMAQQCCDLNDLESLYRKFNHRYASLADSTEIDGLCPEQAFVLRLMIIHDFRRIILRDPTLPEALLPSPWEGGRAFALCGKLYHQVWQSSEQFIQATFGDGARPAYPNDTPYMHRFPG